MELSRYENLIFDGNIKDMPKITISKRETDRTITYDSNKMRLDRISGSAYGSDTYGWLIMLANPEYSIEYDIPTGTVIRVPFPFKEAIDEFVKKIFILKNK